MMPRKVIEAKKKFKSLFHAKASHCYNKPDLSSHIPYSVLPSKLSVEMCIIAQNQEKRLPY